MTNWGRDLATILMSMDLFTPSALLCHKRYETIIIAPLIADGSVVADCVPLICPNQMT